MTERQWLKCKDPDKLFVFLQQQCASKRKLQLLYVACVLYHVKMELSSYKEYLVKITNATKVIQNFFDGKESQHKLNQACRLIGNWSTRFLFTFRGLLGNYLISGLEVSNDDWIVDEGLATKKQLRQARLGFVRDIFGNPFVTHSINPQWLAWNDRTVARMALKAYKERDFSDMPILADALEEAGCTDSEILGHLRGPGSHVRGCWVVDLLLGKK